MKDATQLVPRGKEKEGTVSVRVIEKNGRVKIEWRKGRAKEEITGGER